MMKICSSKFVVKVFKCCPKCESVLKMKKNKAPKSKKYVYTLLSQRLASTRKSLMLHEPLLLCCRRCSLPSLTSSFFSVVVVCVCTDNQSLAFFAV